MNLGERLRALRIEKKLSPRDIEQRTGLLRPYISRVENGHTRPSVETLVKLAAALEVPLYRLFVSHSRPRRPLAVRRPRHTWNSRAEEMRFLNQFLRLLERISDSDRALILHTAQKMTRYRH